MIRVPTLNASAGSQIVVPIIVDETIAGVQFIISFDPTALEFVSFIGAAGSFATSNELQSGQLSCVVSQAAALLNPVCTITFNVTSSSALALTNVVGASVDAQDVPLAIQDGEVIVGGNMPVLFQWVDNNPVELGVIDQTVYQGTQADPATGTWNPVGTVPVGTTQLQADIASSQGVLYFYVVARNGVGVGDPSVVVPLNTDLPQALENLTVQFV